MRLTSPLLATIRHHNAYYMDCGLFGGAKIRFGDRVSPFGNRSRRKFELNIHWSSLYSSILGRTVRVKVTTDVLERIDEAGGLDNYILGQRVMENTKAEWLKKAMVLGAWQKELAERGLSMSLKMKEPIRLK
jgi:large subunit ribosomal protein L28